MQKLPLSNRSLALQNVSTIEDDTGEYTTEEIKSELLSFGEFCYQKGEENRNRFAIEKSISILTKIGLLDNLISSIISEEFEISFDEANKYLTPNPYRY